MEFVGPIPNQVFQREGYLAFYNAGRRTTAFFACAA